MIIRLDEMYVGETAEIVSMGAGVPESKRLRDMGIREGNLVDLLHLDPLVSRKVIVALNSTRVAFDLELARSIRIRPLKSYYETVRTLAHYDSLTGCLNRHATNCALTAEYEKFAANDIPLSVLFTDIDHFKRINDSYGHAAGDEVLKDLSTLLRQLLRRSDLLCRWGGEEFLILLRGTLIHEAGLIAERLRLSVEQHAFSLFGDRGLLTVSIGGCGLPPDRPVEQLIATADTALYRAKDGGRNQVWICRGESL